jgi:hypothetical protein
VKEYLFYNPDIKWDFIKSASQDYKAFCKHVYILEKQFNKDLYDFELDEIEKFMDYYEPRTIKVSRSLLQFIKKYFKYSIDKELCTKNPVDEIKAIYNTDEKWIKQFVTEGDLLFNYNEIKKIQNRLLNKQDEALLSLLFVGLKFDEILDLKKKDIIGNKIKLRDREILIDDYTLKIINEASEERKYKCYVSQGKGIICDFRNLLDSEKDYIIKRSYAGRKSESRVPQLLNYRFRDFMNSIGLEDIRPVDISNSGMCYIAWNKFFSKKDGAMRERLSNKDNDEIATIFGNYSYTSMRDVITKTNCKRLYLFDKITIERGSSKKLFSWWKVKEENGKKGEEIFKNEILALNKFDSIEKMVDSRGYDFEILEKERVFRVEVKTVNCLEGTIFLTRNEIEKAYLFDDEYWICIVHLKSKIDKSADLYLINNPSKLLNIDISMIGDSIAKNDFKLDILPQAFSLSLNNNIYLKSISLEMFANLVMSTSG